MRPSGGRAATPTAPTFASRSELWDDVAALIRDDRRILVLDDLPWAIEADGAMLSALQYAWDIHFQHSGIILVVCGSQMRTMETILHQQTPLFGRLTAQYRLQPFPFEVIRQFFPMWSPDAQVAIYAMVGGVPHYLSWFSADRSLNENIRQSILAPASVALSEIELLLADEVCDIRTYLRDCWGTVALQNDRPRAALVREMQHLRIVIRFPMAVCRGGLADWQQDGGACE